MIYKLLKQPFFGRFMVKWQNPMNEEQKKEWQTMKAQSKSGATLSVLYAPARTTSAKATIVMGHPMGKEAKGYFIKHGYTDWLRANGYNTLVFDINGFGESTHGNFSYFEDIITASQIARQLTPTLPIGYHGISLGGMWSTVAFADPQHEVDFAIIESAATTLDEFWIKIPPAYLALRTFNILMPRYRAKIKMIDRIKEARKLKALLFIYSKTDEWTPASMGERYRQNSPVPAELWLLEEGDHAAIMKSAHREVYKQKIVDYFDRCVAQSRSAQAG